MEAIHLTTCASCGMQATMRCAGCTDAPDYDPGDSTTIVYCDRDCQKKHWTDHKSRCRVMKQRKMLLRAATILRSALLTYREILYDIDLTKIEAKDGMLYLYQNQRSVTSRVKWGSFPDHLTSNVQHREAALTINQCTLATALLSRPTKKLLTGVNSNAEVLDIRIGKPLLPPKLIPGPDLSNCPHTVIKVRLLSTKELWIIDTAGCQYGFREVLVLFDKYIADKACQVVGTPTTYNWTETKDLDYFSTLPFMNNSRAQKQDREVERKARLHFADFVDRHVSVNILDGSALDFSNKLASLVERLKIHMLSFAECQNGTRS
ncbi:zinc finger MYND-type [Fusarium tjaetaba]|uniref:Zinc finger MYND-type n=1 Tax=Fusarium tjaetaba TaxID=1567544 RepID=A0A8H5W7W3_9HYPO|nr:zinc finger MYND-type [Fusarium tjaetaba]KAF5650131.1 zinc finger MYND-type [Fusarium tjaetaba]